MSTCKWAEAEAHTEINRLYFEMSNKSKGYVHYKAHIVEILVLSDSETWIILSKEGSAVREVNSGHQTNRMGDKRTLAHGQHTCPFQLTCDGGSDRK